MRAGAVDDFAPGVLTPVTVGNAEMVVVHDGEAWYAFPDRCTHAKRPLSDGDYDDGVVTCVYHGATFDLRADGKPTMPALRPLACYTVEVEDDEVWVRVS